MFKKEIESIKRFGFIDATLVREVEPGVYEIVDGEHRWKAAKELGYTRLVIDNLGKIEDAIAKVLTLVMNNTRGKDDVLKRAQLLAQIRAGQQSLFEILPFDVKQIEEELKLLDYDFDRFKDAKLEPQNKDLYAESLKVAITLERLLRKIHEQSKTTTVKLLLEGYFNWLRTYKDVDPNQGELNFEEN
jgi:ParB-like chromosome segregation protein Spo0J